MSRIEKNTFIGRKAELKRLEDLTHLSKANLVVIQGRRRIGKSRLVAEFAKNKVFLSLSGLAPIESMTAQDQRDAFSNQLSRLMGMDVPGFQDWSDAFYYLSQQLTHKPTVILLDEISWMGSKDPTFIPKLKVWWDLELEKRSNVTLALCGSVSTWVEDNIINSTALFGRISLQLALDNLTLPESMEFLQTRGFKASHYDILKVLAVTGGIPWYLEQISPQYTADENIKRLCFTKGGLLTVEFDKIFYDLFSTKGTIYKNILHVLAEGMKSLAEIRKILDYSHSGFLSELIKSLIISGFVTRHYNWSLKTGRLTKQSLYRLSDNYLRFFLKYIEPNMLKIEQDRFQDLSLQNLPGWDAMMGFQIETLLLKNRGLILKALDIRPENILGDNPYIQRPKALQKGCQIDYLVETHTNNLFVCEFKFKRRELGLEIIEDVQEKIARFSRPKGYGVVPVLIHFGGVSDAVHDKQYFYRIIDIHDFLE